MSALFVSAIIVISVLPLPFCSEICFVFMIWSFCLKSVVCLNANYSSIIFLPRLFFWRIIQDESRAFCLGEGASVLVLIIPDHQKIFQYLEAFLGPIFIIFCNMPSFPMAQFYLFHNFPHLRVHSRSLKSQSLVVIWFFKDSCLIAETSGNSRHNWLRMRQ